MPSPRFAWPKFAWCGTALLPRQLVKETLPTAEIWGNVILTTALVDIECSRCIDHVSCCSSWKQEAVSAITVRTQGSCIFVVDVLVVDSAFLGFPFIFGMWRDLFGSGRKIHPYEQLAPQWLVLANWIAVWLMMPQPTRGRPCGNDRNTLIQVSFRTK